MTATAGCHIVAALALLWLAAATPGRASVLLGEDLSNFQQEYACDNATVRIVRPRGVRDIQDAVVLNGAVKASGAGHSWNGPFFCASPQPWPAPARLLAGGSANATSGLAPAGLAANIAVTTIRPLAIDVNASNESVWVDAAVITADLLEYLANYVTEEAPAGWTLPAFPWFVYQTIAGAVATGTHGSSMAWGTMSSGRQLLGLEVVLADGSLRRFTPQDDPFLFRALRVSVGKLGVIVRVQLRIVREVPVRRSLVAMTPTGFLARMAELQDAARAAKPGRNRTELPAWTNETEWFWVPQKHQFFEVDYTRADDANVSKAAAATQGFRADYTTVFESKGAMLRLGALEFPADGVTDVSPQQLTAAQPLKRGQLADRAAQAVADVAAAINSPVHNWRGIGGDIALGNAWPKPKPNHPSVFYAAANMAEGTNEVSRIGILTVAGNASVESTSAYIKQPHTTLPQLRRTLYDQYEASFPLTVAADCLGAVLEAAYGADLEGRDSAARAVDKGFRTAPLIRLVGADDGLLSLVHDGPRVFINVEDYLFYNLGRRQNTAFRKVMAALTGDSRCNARGPVRLHWGKAGWPDPGCFRGDEAYGDNWCSFGCAVRQLDPGSKFRDSAPDRWTWAGVDLARCCGPDGFKAARKGCECRVRHARAKQTCPPPPFYTYR